MAIQSRGDRSMGAWASRADHGSRACARAQSQRAEGSQVTRNFSARQLFCHPREVDSGEASRPRTLSNVAEYFGRLAGTYGDGAYYANRRRAVIDAIAGEIANARDVLDVGCGNGAYLTKFVEASGSRR